MIHSKHCYTLLSSSSCKKRKIFFLQEEKSQVSSFDKTKKKRHVFLSVIITQEKQTYTASTSFLSMSVSKLESLPNELLIEIFEKYLNGLDVLNIFSCLKNGRFNQLIHQCQHWYFDFRHCRKDSFQLCLNFPLMNFVERIEELFLSDQNTPGQTQAFLSFFPSLGPLKRLRKLYFYINSHSADWPMITTAIRSLSETPIDTISFEIINTEKDSTLNQIINDIIALKTIKRFSFTSDAQPCDWFPITTHSSTIEYLKYSDRVCEFENLPHIFQCCSHLKYLNIQLMPISHFAYHHALIPLSANIISMPTLHTLILSFMPHVLITMTMLAEYLKAMPALRRLEIKANNGLLNANAWQDLLQTSLPSLTHFRLKSTTSRIKQDQIERILASFETPFWIEKTNFYLIITEHKILDSDRTYLNNRLIEDQDEFLQPVTRWWIVPTRARIDDIPTKDITHIGITNAFKYLSDYYYFKNIKHLVVYNLDSDLIQCLVRCVNFSGIEHLDVSFFDHESHTIISLLSYLDNMTSLRIQYGHLLAHPTVYLEKSNQLKSLDISVNDHSFSENDILTISKLFPKLERLAINTRELSNVPFLNTHLPHLRTLTFRIMNDEFSLNHNEQKILNNLLRQQVKFLFRVYKKWLTIWIDETVFKDTYWQRSLQL